MKRYIILILAIFAIVILSCDDNDSSNDTGTVSGIINDGSRAAAVGVLVTVGAQSDITDPEGEFSVTDVLIGENLLTMTGEGFTPYEEVITVVPGDNTLPAPISLSRVRAIAIDSVNAKMYFNTNTAIYQANLDGTSPPRHYSCIWCP